MMDGLCRTNQQKNQNYRTFENFLLGGREPRFSTSATKIRFFFVLLFLVQYLIISYRRARTKYFLCPLMCISVL